MAKHVLESVYDPNTVYACELWTYADDYGQIVLCLNDTSGTYKPGEERLETLAAYLRQLFGIKVEIFAMSQV